MTIVTFSEIIALKCRGPRRRTKVELDLFFFLFCMNSVNYSGFVGILGGGVWSYRSSGFFKCSEWKGKVSCYARVNASTGT